MQARSLQGSILRLLEQHGPLGYERLAELLGKRPGEVRPAVETLRERGLISLLSVGELVGDQLKAASYWRLTDAGLQMLAN